MASIVKRKKKYSVVYTYTDENGNKRQKWETFETNAEAKKRKLQVEYEQESGTFIPPSAKTVNDLLDEYMSIYGVNTWAMSTYESRKNIAKCFQSSGQVGIDDQKPCGARYAAERRTQDQGYLDSRSAPEGSGSL